MLDSLYNHQYTNISSNLNYQLPNSNRANCSFSYAEIQLSKEQKISNYFHKILEENASQVLNYLLIPELSLLRGADRKIQLIIDYYYSIRLNIQYNDIKNFENKNKFKKEEFLKIYEYQIPLSTNNWFHYDIEKTIDVILSLDRKTISQLRGIKKLKNLNEIIYAPFCIIFNYNSKSKEIINNGWKKVADNIISDSKFFINIANLNFENFEDEDILEAFIYLNEIEYNIDKIKRYSFALYEINNWCKSVVIYYILVHPYRYRNIQDSISKGSNIYKYVIFMDEIINKFYFFKAYLELKKIIKVKLGEYIFTFNYQIQNDDKNKNEENINQFFNEINNEKIISNVLSYLSLKESFLFINVSKFCFNCFKTNLNILCYNILKKIFILKYNSFNDLYSLMPILFENNIFSNYFYMLEDIINPPINKESKLNKLLSFLTIENINDIKNYKGNNELINSICKIFCKIYNIKSEKSFDKDFYLVNLYIKSVILLCYKGNITKIIRYFNAFNLNNNQIKVLHEELSKIYSLDKIKKVKDINKGFYQLLLWEIYLFEYLKQYNPFLFIKKNIFLNNETINDNQKNIINLYIDLMNKLKQILNFKYHFDLLFMPKNKNQTLNFITIISNLLNELRKDSIYDDNIEAIIRTYNTKQSNISKAYFQCKNMIENRKRPSLYEKIMEELILVNIEKVKDEENEVNNMKNNILKDEKYYINLFLGINNKNFNNRKNKINSRNNNIENVYTFRNNYSNKFLSSINNNKLKLKNNNIKNNEEKQNNYINIFTSKSKKVLDENYIIYDKNEFNNYNNYYRINKSDEEPFNFIFKNKNNRNVFFYDIPEEIIITKILFYLSIYDFPNLSLVNKFFYSIIKTHIYIRLFFLEKKKNNIEVKYNDIILRIRNKRNQFFKDNNVSPPNLKHACILFSHFNNNDIYELKKIFRFYKQEYEIIISVLCFFLDIKPNVYIDNEGNKIIDFFSVGKNLIYRNDFIKIIQNMDLDSLNYNTFQYVEKIMQNEAFSLEKINKYYSPSLVNLINLEMGVMEYFRAIRKYCLNFYDYNILDKEEINFCKKMDEKLKIYYKIKNYTFNKCQENHQQSINYLKNMDLEENLYHEIEELDNKENCFNNINNGMNIIMKA